MSSTVENENIAKIISFINMKGGVGKTTLAKDLGFFLANIRNKRILFIDLDPQSNLTQSFFRRYGYLQQDLLEIDESEGEDNKEPSHAKTSRKNTISSDVSIHKLFTPGIIKSLSKDDCILKINENISIIPGTLKAIFSERNSNIENHLYNYLTQNKISRDYDYIFIDCPPTYSNYTISALITSDFYITPSRPDAYSVLGIQMLNEVVNTITDEHQVYFQTKTLKHLGVIFTELSPVTTGQQKLIAEIKSSEVLNDLDIYFFDQNFVYNSHIPKRAEYFVSESSSISKDSLIILADEFERRVNSNE